MASTQYTTKVELFQDCPFDNTYEHTLQATTLQNKINWLEANCTYNANEDKFDDLMYIKIDSSSDRGTMRLKVKDMKAFGYNYCYINFLLKGYTYFCFITGCRYINDANTGQTAASSEGIYEFDIEIDLLMTNLLNEAQLRPCFVERQHSKTDKLYENLEPEPIAIPEHYKVKTTDVIYKRAEDVYGPGIPADMHSFDVYYSALVIAVADAEGWQVQMDGVYMPVTLYYVSMNDPAASTQIRTIFRNHSGLTHQRDIVACYMVPKFLIDDFYHTGSSTDGQCINNNKYVPTTVELALNPVDNYNTYGGKYANLTIKNNKLYAYPYRFSMVSTHEGNDVMLRDEFFANRASAKLQMYFTVTPSPVLRIVPKDYANEQGLEADNCTLTVNNFPMVPWAYSAYDQFIADSFLYKVKRAGGLKEYAADFQHTAERLLSDLF